MHVASHHRQSEADWSLAVILVCTKIVIISLLLLVGNIFMVAAESGNAGACSIWRDGEGCVKSLYRMI